MGLIRTGIRKSADWVLRAAGFSISIDDLDQIVENYYSGTSTEAGINVNPHELLRYAIVYSITKNLATDLAKLPLPLYRTGADGSKELATNHPVYRLLRTAPNPRMTPMRFRQTLWFHVFWHGNAYALKTRNRRGDVTELWLLNPGRVTPAYDADSHDYLIGYRLKSGEEKVFRPDDIFEVGSLSGNGIVGVSPLQQVSESMGSYVATERNAAAWHKNGGRPSILLNHKVGFKDEDAEKKFYEKWQRSHNGANRYGVGVLQKGLEYVAEFKSTPEEAQMLQTRLWHKQDLAQILRIPLHMLDELSRATFSNIAEQDLQYVKYAILDWCILLEQEIERQLLTEAERGQYFARHKVDALLRADIEKRYRAYALGRQWGWFSVNDVLALEDMNPIPGGNSYLRPANMTEIGPDGLPTPGQMVTPAAGAASPGDPPAPSEDERATLLQIMERLSSLEAQVHG